MKKKQSLKRLAGIIMACLLLIGPVLNGAGAETAPFEGVIYEVFVRAFADSNGDGIGDLQGLISKLDYLEQLGVTALWLMPIHPSPSYHGYDVTDYRDINPDYGSLADFSQFLTEAHSRGMKVLLDVPLNHTSSKHPWFIESHKEDSPLRTWYHWAKEGDEVLDKNLKVWGSQPWKQRGNSWYYAIFWDGMPDLNYNNPAVFSEALDIARFWLNLGVDGFRLDATSHIFGEGETQRMQDIAASSAFWQDFSAQIKQEFPSAFLLGEAWESLDKRAEIIKGMDAVVNFDVGDRLLPLLKMGGSGAAFIKNLEGIYAAYEQANPAYVDAPFLSNHDQNRVAAVLGRNLPKMSLAARVLLSLPGVPIIYYGEEIGMLGAKPDEELRTPMLWGNGDTSETRWHSSKYNLNTQPVAQQQNDPGSLLNLYTELIHLRLSQPALMRGKLSVYESENSVPLAYWMAYQDERLLILHNPSMKAQELKLPTGLTVLYTALDAALDADKAFLPPLSSLILEVLP